MTRNPFTLKQLKARTKESAQDLKSFEKEIRDFAENLLPEQVILFQKKLVFDILAGVVMLTPVDLGRARGGWMVTINQMPTKDPNIKDTDGGTTIEDGTKELGNLKFGQVVYITNNVFYIEYLEEGTPKMAPVGMLKRTIARLRTMFE